MATSVPLYVNGQSVTVNTDDPEMPLLYALRDHLKLRAGAALARGRFESEVR